jgi:hypothetical protein
MAEYTLSIKIDQEHVKHFNTSGYKLCVASGVQTGGTVSFNVVAFSSRELSLLAEVLRAENANDISLRSQR